MASSSLTRSFKMAGYNELQVGRYSRLSGKLFSMKGPGILNALIPELALTIACFYGAENRYLESWERFATTLPVTGGAGQNAAARIRNPTGSNVVAVVEKLTASSSAADQPTWYLSAQTGDLTTLTTITSLRLDPRGRILPTLAISTTTNYTPPANSARFRASYAANQSYDFVIDENQEITILPGDALDLASPTNATLLIPSFLWRERFLEESERT